MSEIMKKTNKVNTKIRPTLILLILKEVMTEKSSSLLMTKRYLFSIQFFIRCCNPKICQVYLIAQYYKITRLNVSVYIIDSKTLIWELENDLSSVM